MLKTLHIKEPAEFGGILQNLDTLKSQIIEEKKSLSCFINPPAEPSTVEFHTVHTLMLDKFITALCDNEHAVIIKSGNPAPAQINEAWESIVEVYSSQSGGINNKFLIASIKELSILKGNVVAATSLLELMFAFPCLEVVEAFESMGIKHFNIEDADSIEPGINKTIATVKSWQVKILGLEKELDDYFNDKGTTAIDLNRDYFNDTINTLGQFQHYAIKEDETTLGKFLSICKKYKAHCAQQYKELVKNKP